MKREMSKARQALVDSYIESLEKEIIPWKQGWSTVKNYNPVTKTQYRGINRLILYNAVAKNNYNDPRWMTFSQIKAANYKLNNAKSKGVPLEKCSLYDMETKKYLNISDVDKIVREENLSRQEKYERFKWSVKVFYVFNASLIEGIEPYTIEEKDIHIGVNDLACRFIDRYCKNANLSIVENFLCECPVYKPVNDMILIPAKGSFDDEYEFVSAVLHECCHSTMKENRWGRSYPNLKTNNERYAFEELYAEIASSFLCADIGIEIKQEKIDNHTAYVQFWYKQIKKNPEIIFSALNGAEEISEYIEVKGELQELLIESKKEIYTEFDEETNTYDLCV